MKCGFLRIRPLVKKLRGSGKKEVVNSVAASGRSTMNGLGANQFRDVGLVAGSVKGLYIRAVKTTVNCASSIWSRCRKGRRRGLNAAG
jgi:hypothetical protein